MRKFCWVTPLTILSSTLSWSATNPEYDTLRLSKLLKPISDTQWAQISSGGNQSAYQVLNGDTLWDISSRLFGDGFYWPKIWAINNGRITNPHHIRPGNIIAFNSGSGSSLPSVQLNPQNQAPSLPPATDPLSKMLNEAAIQPRRKLASRSKEWRQLPRQKWEDVSLQLPSSVDPDGFDTSNKIVFHNHRGIELKSVVSTSEITTIGTIYASDSEAARITLGDRVYLDTDEEIEIGQKFTVISPPQELISPKNELRKGYSYVNKASLEIVEIQDDLVVGRITEARDTVSRGDSFIPFVEKVELPEKKPAEDTMVGTMLLSREYSTFTTGQFKQVIIDRGSDDGVEIGMVFRAYQFNDPATEEEITETMAIRDADFLVISVSEQFSAAIIEEAARPLSEEINVILLTDDADIFGGDLENEDDELFDEESEEEADDDDQKDDSEIKDADLEEDETEEDDDFEDVDALDEDFDELDELDAGSSLSEEEKRELRQLEDWKKNPVNQKVDTQKKNPPKENEPEEEREEEELELEEEEDELSDEFEEIDDTDSGDDFFEDSESVETAPSLTDEESILLEEDDFDSNSEFEEAETLEEEDAFFEDDPIF